MEHIEIGAPVLFYIGPMPVTNTIFSAWVTMALLVGVSVAVTRRMRLVPTGMQNLVEYIVELLVGVCETTAGKERGRQFLPFVATSFLFILSANWMGLIPGYGDTAWLRSANSDLNITAAMALIIFILSQALAIKTRGPLGYVKEFFVPNPLHILSELSRPVSLAFRLFGNIFAGEVLLATMAAMLPVAVPAVFFGLEVFVGIVQALIFSMLSLVFLTIATSHHGSEEAHH